MATLRQRLARAKARLKRKQAKEAKRAEKVRMKKELEATLAKLRK